MTQLRATFGDALLRAHRALIEDLQDLESARPADGGPVAELVARLARTRAVLAEHFRLEEHNGYLGSLVERHPHLERAVGRLANEHRELLQSLGELQAEAQAVATATAALRHQVDRWVRKVRRHEQSENILVEDAFNLDLGAED